MIVEKKIDRNIGRWPQGRVVHTCMERRKHIAVGVPGEERR